MRARNSPFKGITGQHDLIVIIGRTFNTIDNRYGLNKIINTRGKRNSVTNNDLEGSVYSDIVNKDIFNINTNISLQMHGGAIEIRKVTDYGLTYCIVNKWSHQRNGQLSLPHGWSVLRDYKKQLGDGAINSIKQFIGDFQDYISGGDE